MSRAGRLALIAFASAAAAYGLMQLTLGIIVSALASATPGHRHAVLGFGIRNILSLTLAFVAALKVLEARADMAWRRRRRQR